MEQIICKQCKKIIAENKSEGYPVETQVYHSMEGDIICKDCWEKQSVLIHKVQRYLKHGIAGVKDKTLERLKGKKGLCTEFDNDCWNTKDLKSAVEGCLKEVLEYVQTEEEEGISELFKKWFEDLI